MMVYLGGNGNNFKTKNNVTTKDDNPKMLSEYFHLPHLTQTLLDNLCPLFTFPYQVAEYHTQRGSMEPPYQRMVN